MEITVTDEFSHTYGSVNSFHISLGKYIFFIELNKLPELSHDNILGRNIVAAHFHITDEDPGRGYRT